MTQITQKRNKNDEYSPLIIRRFVPYKNHNSEESTLADLAQLSRKGNYDPRPTRRNKSAKRGSDRIPSKAGSTLIHFIQRSCALNASSSHSKARSLSPRRA